MSSDKITCTAILKTGSRSNQPCGSTVVPNTTFCKRHSAKDETTPKVAFTPKIVKSKKEDNIESSSTDLNTTTTTEVKKEEVKRVRKTVKKEEKTNEETKKESKKETKKEIKKSNAISNEGKPIFEIIEKRKTLFQVMKNKFGNFEHVPTGFVFDNKTDEAIGKQNKDGTIQPLTLNDIELCKENNWSYRPGLKVLSNGDSPIKKPAVIVEDDDDYDSQDDENEEEVE